jgi:hypothetical protein
MSCHREYNAYISFTLTKIGNYYGIVSKQYVAQAKMDGNEERRR